MASQLSGCGFLGTRVSRGEEKIREKQLMRDSRPGTCSSKLDTRQSTLLLYF